MSLKLRDTTAELVPLKKVKIEIDNDKTHLTINREGKDFKKEVPSDHLMNVLETVSASFETPLLPRNTRFFCQKGNEIALILELPHTVRNVSVHRSNYEKVNIDNVPLPTAIFLFSCSKSASGISVRGNRMFAVKQAGITSLDEPIYRYPTSDADLGGTVCWGNLHDVMRAKELWAVGEIPRRFFVSNFNEIHWYPNLEKVATDAVYDKDLVKYLQGLTKYEMFLDEWLVPASPQKTLRDAMKQIFYGVLT